MVKRFVGLVHIVVAATCMDWTTVVKRFVELVRFVVAAERKAAVVEAGIRSQETVS